MNKLLTTLALALSLSSPAVAKERTVHTSVGIPVRVDVPCKMALHGTITSGKCQVARLGPDTMFQFPNGSRYMVSRDEHDDLSGVLRHTYSNKGTRIADVKAIGSCWMGDGVLLCAK